MVKNEGGRAYFDFGVFAYEDGDYGDAEANLKQALKFEPENPLYNHYLGKTYLPVSRLRHLCRKRPAPEAQSLLHGPPSPTPAIQGGTRSIIPLPPADHIPYSGTPSPFLSKER